MRKIPTLKYVAVGILASATYCWPQYSRTDSSARGNLTVVPIDRSKSPSDYYGAYEVKEFVDVRSKADLSRLFGNGNGRYRGDRYYAAHVPYGRYRIKLQSKSSSVSFGRYVDVCKPDERVEVPREFARVHFVPVLATGDSVGFNLGAPDHFFVLNFQNSLDGTEMSDFFKSGVADQIPYGHYDAEFILPLGSVKREVDVFQPEIWIFSDSSRFYGDSDISGPENIVTGELKNIPEKQKPIFMIMSGIYTPYTINSVVVDTGNGSGTFRFVGTNPSAVFMLFTIGKSGVLDAREFQIPGNEKLVIDLAHPSPPKIESPETHQ